MRSILSLLIVCAFFSCSSPPEAEHGASHVVHIDLDSLTKRGTLVLLTENTSNSYFLYRGQPLGFDYDMVGAFAEYLDLDVEVKVMTDVHAMFEALDRGEGDLIACNLGITADRSERMRFSDPVDHTRMVLVQPEPAEDDTVQTMLGNWYDLSSEHQVHVHRSSTFYERLVTLQRDSALLFQIVEADTTLDSETLIESVADGLIPFTVGDENMARVNRTFYPNLDVSVPLGPAEPIAWAVRTNAPHLHDTLNYWLGLARTQRKRAFLSRKYFDSPRHQRERVLSAYSSLGGGAISPYDAIIQVEAERIGWDWRLVASLIYHESRFNPDAHSWAGAQGLMQLMPRTGERFGADSLSGPAMNIHAGTGYLAYLDRFWEKHVPDSTERQFFILASYNIGPGHVLDAQCLADSEGLDRMVWFDNVERMLARKSESEFYRRDCCKHGYCRGRTATSYVRNIVGLYQHYLTMLDTP